MMKNHRSGFPPTPTEKLSRRMMDNGSIARGHGGFYFRSFFWGKKNNTSRSVWGFTLIELLLYVSVAGLLLAGVSMTFTVLFISQVKGQVVLEVEAQGAGALAQITQSIRNANVITNPQKGVTSSTLTLAFLVASTNPTIFDVATSTLRIREGTSTVIALTNSKVLVSGLSFTNLSRTTSTPGIIRLQFTITHVNPGGRNEYNYQRTFIGSASLR